jgi:serine/threonine protein kinase
VAEGLHYLHSCNEIHGDLNGVCVITLDLISPQYLQPNQSSVLVDATGHARITDFGLAMVTQGLDSIRGTGRDHSAHWIAPEILSSQGTYSKEADVFSFAGLAIEVRYRQPARG